MKPHCALTSQAEDEANPKSHTVKIAHSQNRTWKSIVWTSFNEQGRQIKSRVALLVDNVGGIVFDDVLTSNKNVFSNDTFCVNLWRHSIRSNKAAFGLIKVPKFNEI